MQIVIEIPEEMYDWLNTGFPDEDDAKKLWQVVKNGMVLPKGHGRLIDFDEINFDRSDFETYNDYSFMFDLLDDAPIILEADKE